jgi:ribosomal protein S18 acetylase RimI-like enzyme
MTAPIAEQTLTIRPLTRADLAAVVAIDAAIEGRSRRNYVERRLAAALREPALHAQFAACDATGLAGYILARVLEGEFGRSEPGLRLEMIGMHVSARGRHGGAKLFKALSDWAGRHGIRDVRTSSGWRNAAMLHWLDSMGFGLAPKFILDAELGADSRPLPPPDAAITVPAGHGPGNEINFGVGTANDNERLALEAPEIHPMTPEDLREIVRIDQRITGRDRSGYIGARLAEAMGDSPIRVSLAARLDGAIIGFVMARADLGDFGRPAAVAVVDTIGVDPDYARRGVGRALLTQLFANLAELQIERVETLVASTELALLDFFQQTGFRPSQRLAFARRLDRAG